MWVSYADDSQGCAITFAEGFFDACYPYDNLTEVSGFSNENYSLYKVKYLDKNLDEYFKEIKEEQSGDSKGSEATESEKEIVKDMGKIWTQLRRLERLLEKDKKRRRNIQFVPM